ncbi:MAG: hypothetical protein R6V85_12990 [Polyangia bacterium]
MPDAISQAESTNDLGKISTFFDPIINNQPDPLDHPPERLPRNFVGFTGMTKARYSLWVIMA